MRQVKHRNAKRAVEFFTLNAGFKQPYKVILDGNFTHTALGFRMEDLEKRLCDLLQATSKKGLKLYVSPCILTELKALGADFQETYQWAVDHLMTLQCRHEGICEPDVCIQSYIGEDNGDHYFVATQDKELRETLGGLVGGATLFLSVNGVHISQPTEAQKWLAEKGSMKDMLPSKAESRTLGNLQQLHRPLKTSSKFKRSKAKGANPLAAKSAPGKKKKRPGPRLREALKAAAAKSQSSHEAPVHALKIQQNHGKDERLDISNDGPAQAKERRSKKQKKKKVERKI